MKLKALLSEDDAVSPVIGVILMVAITVILAAVIATFVLGLGEQVSDTTPNANFQFDYEANDTGVGPDSWDNDNTTNDLGAGDDHGIVTITHTSGPAIDTGQLAVTGSSANSSYDYDDWTAATNPDLGDEVSAGDSVDVWVASDDSISVVWQNDDGDSATLGNYDAPDA